MCLTFKSTCDSVAVYMTKNTMKKNTLPNDFVIADSYTVIEPALSNFKQDQSITHSELLDYLKTQPIDTIAVLPELKS